MTIALLAKTYPSFGPGEDAPERTFTALTRVAAAWFVICGLVIGVVERWSPHVVRYLALAILAPSTLMYFGHRDFAYLSLNVAAFPLLAHGISTGSKRLEAGGALSGLGAALHAFGLLSLVGAWIGALVVRARIIERFERILRIAAWGTAAWVGWLAIYMIVLNLGIATSHADSGSWRPLFIDEVGRRRNVAIFSQAGVRDILVSAWVVGVPLLVVAASLWKQHRDQVSLMFCYALPSVLLPDLLLATPRARRRHRPRCRNVSSGLRRRMALRAAATTHDNCRGATDLRAPWLLADGSRHTICELDAAEHRPSSKAVPTAVGAQQEPNDGPV